MEPIDRRDVLRAMQGLAVGALLDGCGGGGGSAGQGIALKPQPRPGGQLAPLSVSVSTVSAGSIGAEFTGLSYEKQSLSLPRFSPDNTDLIGMFRRLGPSLLRIGGYTVDQTQWAASGAGLTAKQVAPGDIDRLAGFLQSAGWRVLYGVNLATSTPASAAAEVAYAVGALGSSLYAVEFGNEPDEYRFTYKAPVFSVQDFEALWVQFRDAVLQAAPGVVFTGPGSAVDITGFTIPFGQKFGKADIALLTQHYYRANGQLPTSTAAELLTPDTKLTHDLALLSAGTASIGVPFRMAETNSYYNGGASGVSNSYASSLWVIDDLFTMAIGGAGGVNLHGGGDSPGYTPIADHNGVVVEARPEFYGVLLFTLAGAGSVLKTTTQVSGFNVTAYAVQPAQGGLNIVLVNKESSQNMQVTIDCGRPVAAAQVLVMSGPSLEATSGVTIQGASVGVDGSFQPGAPYALQTQGNTVTCYVGALSAALIQVS
jgi:hypothetical protein